MTRAFARPTLVSIMLVCVPAVSLAQTEACARAPTPACVVEAIGERVRALTAAGGDTIDAAFSIGTTAPMLRSLETRKALADIVEASTLKGDNFRALMKEAADPSSDWHAKLKQGDYRGALAAVPKSDSSYNLASRDTLTAIMTIAIESGRVEDVLAFARARPAPKQDYMKLVLAKLRACKCADAEEFAAAEDTAYEPANAGRRMFNAALRGDRAALRKEISTYIRDPKARRPSPADKTSEYLQALKEALGRAALGGDIAANAPALVIVEEMPAFVSTGSEFFVGQNLGTILGRAVVTGDATLAQRILERHVAAKDDFISMAGIRDEQLVRADPDAIKAFLPKLSPPDRAVATRTLALALILQKKPAAAVALLGATKLAPDQFIVQALVRANEPRSLAQAMTMKMTKSQREDLQGYVDIMRKIVERETKGKAIAEALVDQAKARPTEVVARRAALAEMDDLTKDALEIACKRKEFGAMLTLAAATRRDGAIGDDIRKLTETLACMDGFENAGL